MQSIVRDARWECDINISRQSAHVGLMVGLYAHVPVGTHDWVHAVWYQGCLL